MGGELPAELVDTEHELVAKLDQDARGGDLGIADRLRCGEGRVRDMEPAQRGPDAGHGAPSDISAARAAGFDEHVIKPAELAKLESILPTRKPSAPD